MSKREAAVITFQGSNEDLLERKTATNLDINACLVVPDTHYAILLKDGQLMNTLNGGRHPIFDAASEKKCKSVAVEVIYLSKTYKLRACWGTRTRFTCRDAQTDIPVQVGARGEFEVQISNPRKAYLELIGVDKSFTLDSLRERLATRLLGKVGNVVAKAMIDKRISYADISYYKEELGESVLPILSQMFQEEYGLKIFSFTFEDIFISDEEKAEIEAARKEIKRRQEEEEKEERSEEKLAEKESREWEKTKFLLELKTSDYEKYLEVCKVIGWDPESEKSEKRAAEGRFCPECGNACSVSDKFCPACGKALGNALCPACGKEVVPAAKFCSHCGKKL